MFCRINFFLKEKEQVSRKNQSSDIALFRVKYFFPVWLRKIIFSPFNPIYAMYKVKRHINSGSTNMIHPVTVDFISYCIENNINFETLDFFPPEDDILIQEHIDNRIKTIMYGYVNKKTALPEKCMQFDQKLENNVRKKNGLYSLSYEGSHFNFIRNDFSYTVFGCYYGLKFLPDNIKDYIKGKDFLDIGALYGEASVMFM
jgi:hypothetical protein